MSRIKHAPGPWWVSGPHTTSEPYHISAVDPKYPTTDHKRCVASVFDSDPRDPENAANAHLIAAAPDLLAACEEGLRLAEIAVRQGLSGSKNFVERCVSNHVSLVQIRAAIAKAKNQPEPAPLAHPSETAP
jgi:hypothetical protein